MPVFDFKCDTCLQLEAGVFVFSANEVVYCPCCRTPMLRKFTPSAGCIPSQAGRMAIHQQGKHGHWMEINAAEIDKKLSSGEYSMVPKAELLET